MKGIPSIGGAGKIFEIFVPGLFFLVNIAVVFYTSPFTSDALRQQIARLSSSTAQSLLIVISFGYLIGVILRMLRAERSDKWAAKYLRIWSKHARKPENTENLYAYEPFPYIEWLGHVCQRNLPGEVQEFYDCVWSPRKSRSFFNFCKIQVISEDERAAAEIYSAESLTRYISSMIYALFLSIILCFGNIASHLIVTARIDPLATPLVLAYLLALMGILGNFRYMRIKEVQTVVYATFKNRSLFLEFCKGKSNGGDSSAAHVAAVIRGTHEKGTGA